MNSLEYMQMSQSSERGNLHVFAYGVTPQDVRQSVIQLRDAFSIPNLTINAGELRGHSGTIITIPMAPELKGPHTLRETPEAIWANMLMTKLGREHSAPVFPPEYPTLQGVDRKDGDLVWHIN